ncbi:hypothetical protein [Beijerinckia mobilis]|uniref:hypothetical protein n=1 Tax=Beijerinckia mobilis TaxID=231434 RepID=UPI000556F4C4|nr:hypothetical protein [Beijerinckia mobilis]
MFDDLPNHLDPHHTINMVLGLARSGELAARRMAEGDGCDDYNARAMEAIFDAIQMHLLPISRHFEEQEKQADAAIQGNTSQ